MRFLGRDAYRNDGNGVVYEMIRVAPAHLRAFRALVRQRPAGARSVACNLEDLTRRGWLQVKYGSTIDIVRRDGEYTRCREGNNPVELLAVYAVQWRRLTGKFFLGL